MLYLFHGDDTGASRAAYLAARAGRSEPDIRPLNGQSMTETDLVQALTSESLFGTERLILIENLFTALGRKETLAKRFAAHLSRVSADESVFLWEAKELSAGLVRLLGSGVRVSLFKLPVLLFSFLDGIRQGGVKESVASLEKLLGHTPAELVFVMLVRRVRDLLLLRDGKKPSALQSWQIARLTRQADSFTMEKLVAMYQNLYEIDRSVKSGTTPFTSRELIEQFLIRHT
ncbi:hypothetical protein M1555_05545 [Patescibacteria group bacterium]|nr:hypothetical protein [Patescibacteria group bacterium]